jgi:hypothetical protein
LPLLLLPLLLHTQINIKVVYVVIAFMINNVYIHVVFAVIVVYDSGCSWHILLLLVSLSESLYTYIHMFVPLMPLMPTANVLKAQPSVAWAYILTTNAPS